MGRLSKGVKGCLAKGQTKRPRGHEGTEDAGQHRALPAAIAGGGYFAAIAGSG